MSDVLIVQADGSLVLVYVTVSVCTDTEVVDH